MACNICYQPFQRPEYKCRLTANLYRSKPRTSIAEALRKFGVTVLKEDERLMICRSCSSALHTAFTKQKPYESALNTLYHKSDSNALIGGKLKDFISATQLVPTTTTSSHVQPRRGKKRFKGTPRSIQKRSKLSKSSEKKITRTPLAAGTSELAQGRSKPGLDIAAQYVRKSSHGKALRLLRKKSKSFTKELYKLVEEEARAEIRNICKSKWSVWKCRINGDKLKRFQQFSWKNAVSEARKHCPLLFSAIFGVATAHKTSKNRRTKGGRISPEQKPTVGAIFGMLSFLGYPQTMRLLQELVGLELFHTNCPWQAFRNLSRLGMTATFKATKGNIRKLIEEFDQEILEKKKELETGVSAEDQVAEKEEEDNADEELAGAASGDDLMNMSISSDEVAEKDKEDNAEEELAAASWDDLTNISLSSDEELAEMSPSSEAAEMNDEEGSVSSHDTEGEKSLHSAKGSEGEATPTDTTRLFPDNPDETPKDLLPNQTEADGTGYTIAFDNVNQLASARYCTRYKGNGQGQTLNGLQAYAAIDRVPSHHLDDTPPTADDILQIDPQAYLPSEDDQILIRQEYILMVQRILTRLMPCFERFAEQVEDHIPHPYSQESSQKSKIIPLGIIDKDETSDADMVDLLQTYHKYVPSRNGKPITTVLFGNGLNCERVRDAQTARSNEATSWDRLEGLHSTTQEWHKQRLLLEDTFKLLYDARNSKAVGTLSYMKNKIQHLDIKPSKLMLTFKAATDLIHMSTEAYVVAAACTHMNIDEPAKMPTDFPEGQNEGFLYFQYVASSVVDMVFQPSEEVEEDESPTDQYCICRSDIEDKMVCCENPSCRHGSWFHISCINMSPEDVPEGEYFCSLDCYVASKRQKRVVGPTTTDDHVLQYSKAMLFRGLGQRVREDAIRENDGDRIISHWRFDMVEFYEMLHLQYFVEGFHLLTDVSGGASERLAHQLRWNRTVNVSGGSGQNTSTGAMMAHLNEEFRLAVRTCGGTVSPSAISIFSQMLGLRKNLFDMRLTKKGRHRGAKQNLKETMKLAKLLLDNNCLKHIPGRSHPGFGDFVFTHALSQEEKFRASIENHKQKRVQRINGAQADAS